MPMLRTANQTIAVAQARGRGNPRRSIRLQNQGPGNVWVQRWYFDGTQGALKLINQGTWLDIPPGPVWQYEWYAQTDTANTFLTVDES